MKINTKVVANLTKVGKIKYPWVGKYKKYETLIVLFTSKKSGVALVCEGESVTTYNHMQGEYKENYWDEQNYEPFYGTIELCMKD